MQSTCRQRMHDRPQAARLPCAQAHPQRPWLQTARHRSLELARAEAVRGAVLLTAMLEQNTPPKNRTVQYHRPPMMSLVATCAEHILRACHKYACAHAYCPTALLQCLQGPGSALSCSGAMGSKKKTVETLMTCKDAMVP